MPLVKFTGTYIEVIDALALPAVYYVSQTVESYKELITKDIPRIAYASFSSTHDKLKERLRQTDNLTTYSYTQGDFVGSVFTVSQVCESKLFTAGNGLPDSISLCYVDDGDTINAFALTHLRDDSDAAEESQRSRFAAVVIKNAAAAPKDRTVSYFSHKTLLSDKSINNGKEISDADFVKELGQALNSKHLSTMLEPMFDGEQLSLQHFNALSARIKSDRNIDNRDEKQRYLERFYQFAYDRLLTNDPQLREELKQIKTNAADDANFFADEQFNKRLINIYQRIDTALKNNNDLKVMNKLNLWIIQLQLLASLCKRDQAFKQQELNLQIQRLSAVINEPNLALNQYRDLKVNQVEAVEQRIRELHECATRYEALYAGSAFTAFMTELNSRKSLDYFDEKTFQETLNYFTNQVPQLVKAKIDELHQSLVQQVKTQARQLQAIGEDDENVPADICEAFLAKATTMSEQATSLTPLELARAYADVTTDEMIERIFSNFYAGAAFEKFKASINKGASQETLTDFNKQLPQQFAAKINELHQSLVKQVKTQARQLQAIGKDDKNVPADICKAFLAKATTMAEQATSLTPLEFAREYAYVTTDGMIGRIFSKIEQEQRLQITDEARTHAKQLPVVEAPKADTRNFVSRNLLSLGVATVGILLTAGLILIATGVLAPIGIAFAGLALIATFVAAAVTATVVVGAGIKIAHDEIGRTNDFDLASQLHDNYIKTLEQIDTEEQTRIEKLSTDLHEHKEKIIKSISSVVPQTREQAVVEDNSLKTRAEVDLLQSLDEQLDEGRQRVNSGSEITITLPQPQSNQPAPTADNVDEREQKPNEGFNSASPIS